MSYCDHRPRFYGVDKMQTMVDRWNGPEGDAVRRYGPSIWPGVPPQALLAFSANSMGTDEALTAAGFWEIGLFNTPAGSPSQPAATGGAWVAIGQGDEFFRLTNRRGVIGSGWRTAIVDQVIIGLIDYRNGIRAVANGIPENVRPIVPPTSNEYSQWAWACGAMGYVNSSSARADINAPGVADELARYEERARFSVLLAMTAGRSPSSANAYPVIRAWQRLETGKVLAQQTGGDTTWFDTYLGVHTDAVEHILTQARYGQPDCPTTPGANDAPGMGPVPSNSNALEVIVGTVAVIAGGKYIYDHYAR